MNACRIEKGYRHWGHDIGPEDDPLDAGLGFCVAWDKPGGFIGREALLRARARRATRRLVQLRLDGRRASCSITRSRSGPAAGSSAR